MGFLDRNLEKTVLVQAEIIQDLIRKNSHLNHLLLHCLKNCHQKADPVALVIKFNNNQNPHTMSLELNTGQSSTGNFALQLINLKTGQPVPEATFANTTATSDNEAIATVVVNSDGTLTATGVSAGVANATVNAIATFIDSTGASSTQSLSAIEVITVDAVVVPDPVGLAISWTTPA